MVSFHLRRTADEKSRVLSDCGFVESPLRRGRVKAFPGADLAAGASHLFAIREARASECGARDSSRRKVGAARRPRSLLLVCVNWRSCGLKSAFRLHDIFDSPPLRVMPPDLRHVSGFD